MGRWPRRPLSLIGHFWISLHPSLSSLGELEGWKISLRLGPQGSPAVGLCWDHTPSSFWATELQVCCREQGRGRPSSCPGFLCLSLRDFYSEKTLTFGGLERVPLVHCNPAAKCLTILIKSYFLRFMFYCMYDSLIG